MQSKEWEIWLADFEFEDMPGSKRRPVLIVPDGGGGLVKIKMTGSPCRDFLEHSIVNWEFAGLSKPTTIRTAKMSPLVSSDLIHKIGMLHQDDITVFKLKLAAQIDLYTANNIT
ncbi:MAG: hypothetical protein LBN97_02435 [Oscillospiraceae bacterium]|nr:hypothetical protein [Oscillospiraceae bacterium]